MIPFLRSFTELMIITESRDEGLEVINPDKNKNTIEEINIKNNHQNIDIVKKIVLPELPKTTKLQWIKSKKAVSRFLDQLDYNNQIQSSLDLTLLGRQTQYIEHDTPHDQNAA